MIQHYPLDRLAAAWLFVFIFSAGAADCNAHARAESKTAADVKSLPQTAAPPEKPKPDLSGRKRVGVASFYAKMFTGRKMADGTPMDPNGDNAASRTLPLGTIAKVTNLETGLSAVVTIQDRGPYVKGRIVDLSPSTARAIGLMPAAGLAQVEVAPIMVRMPDGSMRRGELG